MSHELKAGDTVWTAAWSRGDSDPIVTSYVIAHITITGDYHCGPIWLRRDLGATTKAGALSALAQSLRKRAERLREDAQRLILDAEYEETRAANVEALAVKAREEEAPKP